MASGNLAAAAAFFIAMGERAEHARHEGVERAAKLIEDKAKAVLGTYDYGWPELADTTQEQRVQQGFTANEPELRSGKLRDSIGHVVDGTRASTGRSGDRAAGPQAEISKPHGACALAPYRRRGPRRRP